MRNFDSWEILVGEVKITHQQKDYTLVGGISNGTVDRTFYIRLYENDSRLVFGTWLHRLINNNNNIYHNYSNILTLQLLEQIIKEAKRLEKMMVFA